MEYVYQRTGKCGTWWTDLVFTPNGAGSIILILMRKLRLREFMESHRLMGFKPRKNTSLLSHRMTLRPCLLNEDKFTFSVLQEQMSTEHLSRVRTDFSESCGAALLGTMDRAGSPHVLRNWGRAHDTCFLENTLWFKERGHMLGRSSKNIQPTLTPGSMSAESFNWTQKVESGKAHFCILCRFTISSFCLNKKLNDLL